MATATPFDDEMRRRIAAHQQQRKDLFTTVEESVELRRGLSDLPVDTQVVLVDCLTVWLGNLYYHNEDDDTRVRKVVDEFCAFLGTSEFYKLNITR